MRNFLEKYQCQRLLRHLAGLAVWALLTLLLPHATNASCLDNPLADLTDTTLHPINRYLSEDFAEKNPIVAQVLRGKALDRWKKSKDPVWKKLNDAIAACVPPAECELHLNSEKITMHIMIYAKKNVLEVQVRDIQLLTGGKSLAYGRRPAGLNVSFANLFGAAMGGIAENLALSPGTEKVKVVGSRILNKPLVSLLQDYGFRRPGDGKSITASIGKALEGIRGYDLELSFDVKKPGEPQP